MNKQFTPFKFDACVKFIKVDLNELPDPPQYNDLYEAWVFAKEFAPQSPASRARIMFPTYICSTQKMAEGWFAGLATTSVASEDDSLVEWYEAWDEFQYQYTVNMNYVDYFDYYDTIIDAIPVNMESVLIGNDKDFADQMNEATQYVNDNIEHYLNKWLTR